MRGGGRNGIKKPAKLGGLAGFVRSADKQKQRMTSGHRCSVHTLYLSRDAQSVALDVHSRKIAWGDVLRVGS